MTLESLQRPAYRSRIRRAALVGAIAATAGFVGFAVASEPSEPIVVAVPVVTPPVVVPAAVVNVAPAVAVPAAVEPAEPPAAARPRALAPTLDAACVLPAADPADDAALDVLDADRDRPTCNWDDGFPAISADGKTIVTKYVPDDGGRGYPGLSIHFIDVRTSKVTRDALVLSPDEYDPEADPTKLRATIARRAAVIQRSIDAGRFRTLAPLGSAASGTQNVDATKIHAEFAGDTVRIIDPAAATVLWRHHFAVAAPKRHVDPDMDMCSAWDSHSLAVWWDPTTRVVLASQDYQTGGCMCSTETFEHVVRM